MPAASAKPTSHPLAAFSVLRGFGPPQPLQAFLRSASLRLRPLPRPAPHTPRITRARDRVLALGGAETRQLATVLRERRAGDQPTLVLGGFVPDSTEQVFLLRSHLLRQGSVYYLNYPRFGFSMDLLCAQLDDLVEDVGAFEGHRPVVLAVSFGAGLLIEWLRRCGEEGRRPPLGGALIISPVACCADVLDPLERKPGTLLARALRPILEGRGRVDPSVVDRSRTLFAKMFESGAQNRETLLTLMSPPEFRRLRDLVLGAIRGIDVTGVLERVRSLGSLPHPDQWLEPGAGPLTDEPVLILYAEKESSVMAAGSPTRAAFEARLRAFFPQGRLGIVGGGRTPVQHASLIFHYHEFLPHVASFYKSLKSRRLGLAA